MAKKIAKAKTQGLNNAKIGYKRPVRPNMEKSAGPAAPAADARHALQCHGTQRSY